MQTRTKWAVLTAIPAIGLALLILYGSQPTHMDANRIVWINAKGCNYHRESCDALTYKSKPTPIGRALELGLTACRKCRPGGLRTSWIALQWKNPSNVLACLTALALLANLAMVIVAARNVSLTRRNVDATTRYVDLTKQLVAEAEKQRIESSTPVVSIRWAREEYARFSDRLLTFTNHGAGVALHTQAELLPHANSQLGGQARTVAIGPLGPKHNYYMFDIHPQTLGADLSRCCITYDDVHGQRFKTTADINDRGPVNVEWTKLE